MSNVFLIAGMFLPNRKYYIVTNQGGWRTNVNIIIDRTSVAAWLTALSPEVLMVGGFISIAILVMKKRLIYERKPAGGLLVAQTD
jgi:hypothetical protein